MVHNRIFGWVFWKFVLSEAALLELELKKDLLYLVYSIVCIVHDLVRNVRLYANYSDASDTSLFFPKQIFVPAALPLVEY